MVPVGRVVHYEAKGTSTNLLQKRSSEDSLRGSTGYQGNQLGDACSIGQR